MRSLSILVAEDEVMIRADMEETLTEAGHVVCGSCGDGQTAIGLARQFQPELVVMDIVMPGINGLEAARAMYQMEIPVVMVTANSQPSFLQRAENIHVYGYIIKPISERNLLATIQIAYARWQEFTKTRAALKKTREVLAGQKQIARARSIIQDKFGISAQQAHQRLLKAAMNYHVTLAEIAVAVLKKQEK